MSDQPTQPNAVTDPNLFGWLDMPREAAAVASTFPARTLSLANPRLFDEPSKRHDVFLFRAFMDVIGVNCPPYKAQTIGDCVSQGAARSGDLTQCLEIVLGDAESYHELSSEVVYGLAREEAGMLGSWGDGCFGTAAGKALAAGAAYPRDEIGPYDGARAREYGYRGVPREIKAAAREHPFSHSTLITTIAEQDAAADNGYVCLSGGMEAFSMTRDANGICARTWGSWAHLMACGWARRTINGAVYYLYHQSWGPNVPSGPTPDGIPNTCFWVHESDHARRLARGDTVAIGNFKGFPGRPLPSAWTNAGWIQ